MNQYKKLLFATLSILLLGICISCEKSKEIDNKQTWEERWVIGSERIIASDGRLCYWVKINDNTEWWMIRSSIKGFTYEEGYEYVVDGEKMESEGYLEEKPGVELIKYSNYIELILPLIKIYFRPH